jgi:hypothetical protein
MPTPDERSRGDRLGQDDGEVRAAVRFAVLAAAGGIGFLIVAALWASGCGETATATATATATCGRPQRLLLAFGGPLILFVAGLWAFWRTCRVWRSDGVWWAWHGAGWFLLTLMIMALAMGAPPIAGPVFGS